MNIFKSYKKFKENNRGMSLVETIIAVAILSVAVIPIIATFAHTTRYNAVAKVKQRATNYAVDVMETYKSQGVENATNIVFGEDYDATKSTYTTKAKFTDSDSKEYDVTVTVEPVEALIETEDEDNPPVYNTRLDDIEATPFFTPDSDILFIEDPKDDYDPYSYIKNIVIDNGFEKSSDVKNLKLTRDIEISIEITGEVTVTYTITGECDGKSQVMLRDKDGITVTTEIKKSTGLSVTGSELKKIFYYYYPAYDHNATVDTHSIDVYDNIRIVNLYGNIDFYLIKQQDSSLDKAHLMNYETDYSLNKLVIPGNGFTTSFYNVITYNLGDKTLPTNPVSSFETIVPDVNNGIPKKNISDNNIVAYKITIELTDSAPIFNSNPELAVLNGTVVY